MGADLARIEELLEVASDLAPAEREAYLRDACADDPELRTQVERLAAVGDDADRFFDSLGAALASWAAGLAGDPEAAGGDDPLVGVEIGRYRVDARLGAGGMGLVYRAHDLLLDRQVALKLLPPHLRAHDAARQRFLVEARAAAALEHPNVCTVHEVGETDEAGPFLAMALYEGETLKDRIAGGPLPIDAAVGLAAQVARGLAAAHERGVVHRDVKPGNIVITADGTAKILDFGLAKLGDLQITEPGVRPGTIAYMSPEQVRGDTADHRSDIWSLGVVLYEMLAGERPFRGPDAAVLHTVVHGGPPPLRERRPDVPAGLEVVVTRLLSRDPDQRFQDAGEIPDALAAALEAPALPYAPRRWATPSLHGRRTRASMLGAAAVLLLGAAVYGLAAGRGGQPAGPGAGAGVPGVAGIVGGPPAVAQDMYFRGLEYLNRPGDADARKFPPAISFFHRALEADPGYSPAYVGLSEAFRRYYGPPHAVRRDSALHYARRAVEAGPELADAAAVLGLAYTFAGERGRAEEQFLRAVELDPEQADALSGLALLAALNGRLDNAVRWERRAVASDPASARRLSTLGAYLFDLGDLDGAAAAFTRALEFSPDFPDAGYLLAHIHRIRGEDADAEARLRELAVAASDHPGTRGLIVRFHAASGRFELAAQDMDATLSGPPAYEAYIAKRLGQDARAAEYISQVEQVLEEWTRDGFPSPRLRLHLAALRDDIDGVLDVLAAHGRSGIRSGQPEPPWIGVYWADHDPVLDEIREEPRFLAWLGSLRAELDSLRTMLEAEGQH